MKKTFLAAALLAAASVAADAAMVTARWGVKGAVQHPGTLKYESAGQRGTLMVFDLSALPAHLRKAGGPKPAAVYRARLFFAGYDWKQKGFDIVPAQRRGPGEDATLKAAGERLAPAAPWYQWLDASDPVRAWAKAGRRSGLLWMRGPRRCDRDATYLEIDFEGTSPAKLPPQVTGVQAVYRSGQVFVTFKEIDPPDGGKDAVTVAELSKKMSADYYAPRPAGPMSYRVYCHHRPITAANIGDAELLGEAPPGSAYNTRFAYRPQGRQKGMTAASIGPKPNPGDALALRVAVEPGKVVPPGTGVYVHTVGKPGKAWYAVVTSADGVTNAAEISAANTAGPVQQAVADPEPVLYKDIVTDLRGTAHHQQWYSFWSVQPMSVVPARYDVVVWHCPKAMARPAPLHVVRHGWNCWPRPPRPQKTTGIGMAHTADQPVEFRLGLHDSIHTVKGFDQGTWKPFHSNRQVALIKWMQGRWPIDPNRIHATLGAWGMMEIEYGGLYSFIHGWGQPELTKGFQCWDRARGIWGTPKMYEGRPDDENPYVACNFTDWVLAHPEAELPFVYIHAGGGAHYTEQGWPPHPRFAWALMQAKQPFVFSTARSPVSQAVGALAGRRDRSLPAFANCTLDDNLGEGDLRSGTGWNSSQVNGYVMWDPETIVDEPDRWEITVWIDKSSYYGECTVDLTPRRCRKFAAKPAQKFAWTNAVLPPAEKAAGEAGTAKPAKPIQSDVVAADKLGLVTIRSLKVTKARHRIIISRR